MVKTKLKFKMMIERDWSFFKWGYPIAIITTLFLVWVIEGINSYTIQRHMIISVLVAIGMYYTLVKKDVILEQIV